MYSAGFYEFYDGEIYFVDVEFSVKYFMSFDMVTWNLTKVARK